MSSSLPSVRGLPAYVGGVGYVMFNVDMDGRIRLARGPALEAVGWTEAEMERHTVFALYQTEPELAAAYRRLFQGQRVATLLRFAGRSWLFDASPIMENGEQVGIFGAAWLQSEEDEAQRQPTTAAFQVWIAPDGTTYHESDYGVLHMRKVSGDAFTMLRDTGAIRLLRPALAAEPAPPLLRLVPR